MLVSSSNGHWKICKSLILQGAEVSYLNICEWDAVKLASANGHTETVKVLAECGDDVNLQTTKKTTALHIASANGHTDVVRELVSMKSVVDHQNVYGWNALMLASVFGHSNVALELLKSTHKVDKQNYRGDSSLMMAAEYGHFETVKVLLDDGANVNLQNYIGATALHVGSLRGHVPVVDELINRNAEMNLNNCYGWTPLMMASFKGHADVVKEFVMNTPHLTSMDDALILACRYGNERVVKELLSSSLSLYSMNMLLFSLHMVSEFGHASIASTVLDMLPEKKEIDAEKTKALYIAVKNGHQGVIEVLLNYGAKINSAIRDFLLLPFLETNTTGPVEIENELDSQIILQDSLDYTIASTKGPNTALTVADVSTLHQACERGYLEVVKLFLEVDSDLLYLCDVNGWDALMHACVSDNGKLVSELLLLKGDSFLHLKNNNGGSLLHIASVHGRRKNVKELINNGVDINAKDKAGHHALILAAVYGHTDVVEELLSSKSQVDLIDKDGRSTLLLSCQYGKLICLKTLLQSASSSHMSGQIISYIKAIKEKRNKEIDGNMIDAIIYQSKLYKNAQDALSTVTLNEYLEAPENIKEAEILEIAEKLRLYCNELKVWGDSSLFHIAAMYGQDDFVQELMECGADSITEQDDHGYTPLMIAATNGHANLFHRFCTSFDVLTKTDHYGKTALHFACGNGSVAFVRKILYFNPKIDIDQTDEFGFTALMYASTNGHYEVIRELIKGGANCNTRTKDGKTALFMCCAGGHLRSVNVFIKHGVKTDIESDTSALHIACKNGHFEVVHLLLKCLDRSILLANMTSCLHTACKGLFYLPLSCEEDSFVKEKNGRKSLDEELNVKYFLTVLELIENGAQINQQDENGWHSLMFTAQNGSVAILKLLISMAVDINLLNSDKKSALHIACENGYSSITEKLIEQGALIDLKNKEGITALHLASQNGHVECVKILLENCADINITMYNSSSLYIESDRVMLKEASENIEEEDVKVDSESSRGTTALYLACQNGHLKVTQELIRGGALVNSVTEEGCTPLHVASATGNLEIVEELLCSKAIVNMQSNNEDSALCITNRNTYSLPHNNNKPNEYIEEEEEIKQKFPQVLKGKNNEELFLYSDDYYNSQLDNYHKGLEHINKITGKGLPLESATVERVKQGWHALLFASAGGHKSVVDMLLINGANVNLQSERGTSALFIASQNGHYEVVKKLMKKKAKINICTTNGLAPLHIAAAYCHFEVVQELLNNGAKVNVRSDSEASPLHFASEHKDIRIINALIGNGANADIRDSGGWSPLTIACRHRNMTVAKSLLKSFKSLPSMVREVEWALDLAIYNDFTDIVHNLLFWLSIPWLSEDDAFTKTSASC